MSFVGRIARMSEAISGAVLEAARMSLRSSGLLDAPVFAYRQECVWPS